MPRAFFLLFPSNVLKLHNTDFFLSTILKQKRKLKMKHLLLTLILTAFAGFSMAQTPPPTPPTGVVTKLRGEVLFAGVALKEGDTIDKVGKIETKNKSYLQIKIEKWKNHISIGPNSAMELNFSDEKKYTLEAGTCRWKSFGASDAKGKIFTKSVSMGVRGTDFHLKYSPILGETEIIMFDGEVMMENLNDKSNTALVKKGQWGGMGGRFGEKISPILDLPKEILTSAEKALE